MTSVVGIIGKSKTGKTTLIEKLISDLTNKGYKIATVKNTFHNLSMDIQGKDSWRHIQAGSNATALSSANGLMIIINTKNKSKLEDILNIFGNNYDLVIVEGYKESNIPKIEVHRKEKGTLLNNIKNLVAIATDERLDTDVLQLPLNNVKEISKFIIDNFLKSDSASHSNLSHIE